jgi:YNFM family putative membrane transporter
LTGINKNHRLKLYFHALFSKFIKTASRLNRLIPGWLILFTLGHFSHHLLTALPVPLMPFIRDNFTLDYAQSGLLLSVFSVSYGISQLPSGWLADRLGARNLMAIGICGVGLSGILIGFSQSYILLMLLLGLMGFVGGGYHPSAPPLVSSTLPTANLGRAIGIHAIGGSAAYFIAPVIASATAVAWGWRSSFIILAAPTLIFGLILYVLMGKRTPRQKNITATGECSILLRKPGDKSNLLAFMALSSITTIIFTATMSFIPLFMVDNFHMSQASAAISVAVIYLTGIFANPVSGFLTDRLGRIPLMITASLCLIFVLFIMSTVPGGLSVYLILVVFGISIALTQTSSESQIVGNVTEKKCSSVLGVYYFVNLTGAGILTPVLGAFVDSKGMHTSLITVAAALSLATIIYLLLLIRSRRPKVDTHAT